MTSARAVAWALVAALLVTRLPSAAEGLPEPGTFEGVYHVDRWGQATVGGFVVPPELRARFRGLEGRPVRIEVLEMAQTEIPGPVLLKALGAVTELADDPQMSVAVTAYPADRRAGDKLTLALTVRNAGSRAVQVQPSGIAFAWFYESGSDVPSRGSRSGSVTRSVTFDRERGPDWNVPLRLRPGESLVARSEPTEPIEAGRHEFGAWVSIGRRPFAAWAAVDAVALGAPRALDGTPRIVTGLSATDVAIEVGRGKRHLGAIEGQAVLVLDWTLRDETPAATRIFWGVQSHGWGRTTRVALRAFDGADREIPLTTWTQISYGGRRGGMLENGDSDATAWELAPLPPDGLRLHAVLWPATAFPPSQPWRLVAEVTTSEGVARVPVAAGGFPALAVRDVPFGTERGHVRLRARPALDPMPATGPQAVFVEAANSGAAPVIILSSVRWEDCVVVEIDGTAHAIAPRDGVWGWASARTVGDPQQVTVFLPDALGLTPGGHALRVGFRSPGGSYTNVFGESIPVLEGAIWSELVTFEVR